MPDKTFADLSTTSTFLTAAKLENITQTVAQEFPDDLALQQVYIARQIIQRESEQLGMDYFVYVRELAKKVKREILLAS